MKLWEFQTSFYIQGFEVDEIAHYIVKQIDKNINLSLNYYKYETTWSKLTEFKLQGQK